MLPILPLVAAALVLFPHLERPDCVPWPQRTVFRCLLWVSINKASISNTWSAILRLHRLQLPLSSLWLLQTCTRNLAVRRRWWPVQVTQARSTSKRFVAARRLLRPSSSWIIHDYRKDQHQLHPRRISTTIITTTSNNSSTSTSSHTWTAYLQTIVATPFRARIKSICSNSLRTSNSNSRIKPHHHHHYHNSKLIPMTSIWWTCLRNKTWQWLLQTTRWSRISTKMPNQNPWWICY